MPRPEDKPFAIPKLMVWEAWRQVKANKGAPGVDGQDLDAFEADLEDNLYKIWNRMSSGTWFPPPVRAVEIPKPHGGGVRMLGVPTIADRVAQTVVAMQLEPVVEPRFHPDSYGYRPGRSAHDALAACRQRCWKYDWVIDLDVQKFFDEVPWDLIIKAVEAVTDDSWVLLYVKRWLAAPVQHPDGSLEQRSRGTPQGSAVSPVLANLFLHYAFDSWMVREFPGCPWERYADDGVPRTLKEDRRRRRYRRKRCCTRDEGARPMVWWPFAVALQGEAANHREVRRSRAGVLSVAEKARCQRVRCGSRRRAKAIPPLKCRKRIGDIPNRGRVIAPGRVWREPADWPGGCPAWMVARA
jgi:retron-type reverse transcriptase